MKIMNKVAGYLNKYPRLTAVAVFAFVLAVFYFVWRDSVTVERGLNGLPLFMMWGTVDVTSVFMPLIVWESDITCYVLRHIVGAEVSQAANLLCHPDNGACMSVVWDCTGLKQVLEFFFIIILFPSCHKHKLWYVPAGVAVLAVFNIFRLVLVFIAGSDGLEAMEMAHSSFKFLFNGLIFVLWLVWAEFVYRPHVIKRAS